MKPWWFFTAVVFPGLFEVSHQCSSSSNIEDEARTTNPISKPRILVVTGSGDSAKKSPLWPKPDYSQCAFADDFPQKVSYAVGFWTAQGPTVCGGLGGEDKCFLYEKYQWKTWTNMETERRYASALQINSSHTLIIGGKDENEKRLQTTELISSSGSKEGNTFPVTISAHCSFHINATHGMVTAGVQNGKNSSATWYVNMTSTTFVRGPPMTTRRVAHGCSIVQLGSKSYGVVSGGYYDRKLLDSTEMINLDQESPTWIDGPKLPRGLVHLTLVQTSQGTYAMGGMDEDLNPRNEVFQLDCPDEEISSCQWKPVENLHFPRSGHVSFALPESYNVCVSPIA